jgi:hypothetical protein
VHPRIGLLYLLAACGSSPREPAPPAAPACLADALGPLDGGLPEPDCGDDAAACGQACSAGQGLSCWKHAVLLQRDPATEPQANDSFRRACELGVANGCTNYAAVLWLSSAPDRREYECARRVFEAACGLDDHFACGMEGRLRLDRGAGDDLGRGRDALERTCTTLGGFPCRILALNLERGVLDAPPPGRIQELMTAACDGGDLDACGEHATVDASFDP